MTEKQKFCPLKMIGGQGGYAQTPFCDEEKCSWWLEFSKECCVVTIAGELADSTISRTSYQ